MTDEMYRIGIVGASSLAGKELSEELGESLLLGASDFVLLDEEEVAGQMTAAGDEVAFIQRLEASSFERMDFVFFTGSAPVVKKHWQEARRAGASIIDMTYALDGEKDVLVRAPWVTEVLAEKEQRGPEPDLKTPAVVAAHPVAVMLALVAGKLRTKLALTSVAATVMEPASEYGRAAMDELHQQTVTLLSFQPLPREQYDAQVSFNLLPALGEDAKVKLGETEERIRRHYDGLAGAVLPALALQIVQAPVFHGYVASMLVEFGESVSVEEVEAALVGERIDVVSKESDPPSNLSAAGQEDIMVRVTKDRGDGEQGRRFWLWLAADNLKLAALNGIACAAELRRLRPRGKVQ